MPSLPIPMSLLVYAVISVGVAGCALEKRKSVAEACSLNSDCDAPLVCRLGRCRIDCANSRDCALGLDCIYDESKLGGCQVPEETRCSLDSDCTPPLVCRMGRCVNECGDDRDCAPGQICCPGDDQRCDEVPGDAPACFEPDRETCAYTSDCSDGRSCAPDNRCRLECREICSATDCFEGQVCILRSDDVGTANRCVDRRLLAEDECAE